MKDIKISVPKGRAYINWFGKKPIDTASFYPAQLVEKTQESDDIKDLEFSKLEKNWHNLLFHGDNKEVLSTLLTTGFRGKIDLIYIDPPFDSGANYVRKIELRGIKANIIGQEESIFEQAQYNDIWKNDSYLQFMYERLILMRELLSEQGSIYLHCDWHKSHHLRFLLDEVFGSDNFVNEVIWHYRSGGASKVSSLARKHDNILHYRKSDEFYINILKERQYLDKSFMDSKQDKEGRYYVDTILRDVFSDIINIVDCDNIIHQYNTRPVLNVSAERLAYPTQKPEGLISLLIELATSPDSIVLDCFMGSGTTQAVAQKLGRRWIGVDCNKGAIQTTIKRLQKIIHEQKSNLLENNKNQYKILHYQVNNYDFRIIQDATEIIFKKYGLQKSNDSFFIAKRGEEFVKIIELHRPLVLLDIQLVIDELFKKDSEERCILIFNGIQDDAKITEVLKNYHKTMPSMSKIELWDIQKDEIFEYKEPDCEVEFKGDKNQVRIKIKSYISDKIIQRLNVDKTIFDLDIKDFRACIDYVLIDTNYNGEIFSTCFSDVPKNKKDFIRGEYSVESQGIVAVKIVSMLGEESIILQT
ncbi:Restriction endonuclease subunit M (plasmid) [Candidatus Trichorickettsia mobilis]|uniref:site-specific DNA-methyltransferase n=1 Tax=Candidatus Trichorickettsia mobilis TaxID=1346319 RepID=UPI002B25666C|nr:site-specific DNA-methyltransferase [Candidatus Trichorickettsia mobilis]WPY01757.1 Restriction endonuclease subunit M [Candidatus Trichorickettsia mobilis]